MSEALRLDPAAAPAPRHAALAARIAAMLRWLADLLDGLAVRAEPERDSAFLRALAELYRAEPASADAGAGERLGRLAGALGLEPLEVELLVLAGLPEEHEGVGSLLAGLHPAGEPRASAGLAAQLFCRTLADRAALRQVLEGGPAVRSGALRLEGDAPLFHRSLLPAPRLWAALRGMDAWPAGVRADAWPRAAAGLTGWLASPACRRAMAALRSGDPWLVLLSADDPDAAADRAAALAAAAGVPAAILSAGAAAEPAGLLAHLAARGLVPIVAVERPEGGRASEPDLAAELAGLPGPLVLCGRAGALRPDPRRRAVLVGVEPLPAGERAGLWREVLPELADGADRLGAAYRLEPEAAAAVAADARALAALEGRAPAARHVLAGVRARTHTGASAAVSLRRPTARWSDLVLPADRAEQLREAVQRLEQQARVLDEWGILRGRPGARGVRLLLAGPPGTGKTLAAEVLAHTLGVDLLVVDLSRLVSKWLGETEKHLAEVFDIAERAQAVLLFDEADALFGRRTEVSDAHDRYANLETAYLLYRLERFEGLTVLSTNLQRNLDPAFLRRLEFVVELGEPDLEGRLELWRRHLPAGAPLAPKVDLRQLAARYPVTGALIRNAATAAAFLAAGAGTPITRELLVHALRREYQKSGRAFPGPPGPTPS